MKKGRLIALGMVVLAVGVALVAVRLIRGRQHPCNVLLITLDTTRADHLGCYGYASALTPSLDRLAGAGVLFEQAFACAPLTLPSHATMLTGLYPPEHALRINEAKRLDPTIPTLQEILRGQRYQTAAFIAAVTLSAKFGLQRGFDTYDDDMNQAYPTLAPDFDVTYRPGNLVTDAALNWLDQHADGPFFCWVHLFDPHFPYHAHHELAGTPLADQESYDAEIAFMDHQVGRLMAFLDQHGLTRRTLVIAVGDHGEGLKDHGEQSHGATVYFETMRVPLIVSWPGRLPSPQRVNTPVSLVDLCATVLDFVNVAHPGRQSGRSLKPALSGQPLSPAPSYGETLLPYLHYGWSPLYTLITDRWKYIRTAKPELYDWLADPQEHNNLAGTRPDQVAQLGQQLFALEAAMVLHTAQEVQLTARETSRLEALGYIGEKAKLERLPEDLSTLADIKDMLPVLTLENRIREFTAQGDLKQAIEGAREAVRLAPSCARIRRLLGTALQRNGQTAEAASQQREAIRLDPQHAPAYLNLAAALVAQGDFDQAITLLAQALRIDPHIALAHKNLGKILAHQGDSNQAIAHLTQAVKTDPEDAGTRALLAGELARQGQLDQAIEHYNAAIRLKPDWPEPANNLAWIMAANRDPRFRDPAKAVQLAERACTLTGHKDPGTLDTLAAAYAAAGRFPEAVRTAQQAIDLATAANQQPVINQIKSRLALYQASQPAREQFKGDSVNH